MGVVDAKQLVAVRLDPADVAEIEALAGVELDGNTSMMIRRLLREALDARSGGSRPVGPAESVAGVLAAAEVTHVAPPGRIVRPAFQEPAADPDEMVAKPVRGKPGKADRMPTTAELRAMARQKGR